MVGSTPFMYAELLYNIRSVSVYVGLKEPSDSATHVELSKDEHKFVLHHGGRTFFLTLPLPVALLASTGCSQIPIGAKEQQWRLGIAPQEQERIPMPGIVFKPDIEYPWAAKDLSGDMEFTCVHCKAVVVKRETIKTWKDLPSENWAEMMEFWHCHKPELPAKANGSSGHVTDGAPDKDLGGHALNKGYGANTAFSPAPGIGFIDISTFLLAETDLTNIQVSITILSSLIPFFLHILSG